MNVQHGSLDSSSGWHETQVEIRYGETDQMGFAHHSVAVSWCELGRVVWMREHGLSYSEVERSGLLMPVVKMTLTYHAPGRFEDRLAIQTRLCELGRAKVAFENRIVRIHQDTPRVLLAEARVDLACVDRAGKIQRIPEPWRALFEKYLAK